MDTRITPKQVALGMGVSESSVKRWCDQGALSFFKTAGGHRRILLRDVISFCRSRGLQIVKPELFGLPSNTGSKQPTILRARNLLWKGLVEGRVDVVVRVITDLYLAGQSVPLICDEVVAASFHRIGEAWESGDVSVYQERRACVTMTTALQQFRQILPAPKRNAPCAIGATMSHDHYKIALSLVEVCLRSLGWRTILLGTNIPAADIALAAEQESADLVWISIGNLQELKTIKKGLQTIEEACRQQHLRFLIGGRGVEDPESRSHLELAEYLPNIQSLSLWHEEMRKMS
jgi:excisionase family DNA binding protein